MTNVRLCGWIAAFITGVSVSLAAPAVAASGNDAEELEALLQDFLAHADERETHDRFWADDLVYTSSNGTRFGKPEIMAGFSEPAADEDGPAIEYTGEDVKVQVFGTAAVVTFKLVGTPGDGSPALYYYNTGTFLKRDGEWRAVAWQATVIPAS